MHSRLRRCRRARAEVGFLAAGSPRHWLTVWLWRCSQGKAGDIVVWKWGPGRAGLVRERQWALPGPSFCKVDAHGEHGAPLAYGPVPASACLARWALSAVDRGGSLCILQACWAQRPRGVMCVRGAGAGVCASLTLLCGAGGAVGHPRAVPAARLRALRPPRAGAAGRGDGGAGGDGGREHGGCGVRGRARGRARLAGAGVCGAGARPLPWRRRCVVGVLWSVGRGSQPRRRSAQRRLGRSAGAGRCLRRGGGAGAVQGRRGSWTEGGGRRARAADAVSGGCARRAAWRRGRPPRCATWARLPCAFAPTRGWSRRVAGTEGV